MLSDYLETNRTTVYWILAFIFWFAFLDEYLNPYDEIWFGMEINPFVGISKLLVYFYFFLVGIYLLFDSKLFNGRLTCTIARSFISIVIYAYKVVLTLISKLSNILSDNKKQDIKETFFSINEDTYFNMKQSHGLEKYEHEDTPDYMRGINIIMIAWAVIIPIVMSFLLLFYSIFFGCGSFDIFNLTEYKNVLITEECRNVGYGKAHDVECFPLDNPYTEMQCRFVTYDYARMLYFYFKEFF